MRRNRFLKILRAVLSVLVAVFAFLQLIGVWKNAVFVFEPMLGVVLLLQAIQEWKRNRSLSIVSLCASVLLFSTAALVLFL